jgi:hypothetical protein
MFVEPIDSGYRLFVGDSVIELVDDEQVEWFLHSSAGECTPAIIIYASHQ